MSGLTYVVFMAESVGDNVDSIGGMDGSGA